jgi:hypothetical protein
MAAGAPPGGRVHDLVLGRYRFVACNAWEGVADELQERVALRRWLASLKAVDLPDETMSGDAARLVVAPVVADAGFCEHDGQWGTRHPRPRA